MDNKKDTKAKGFLGIISLITIVTIAIVIIGFAYAKYVNQSSGNAQAQIAKWHFAASAGSSENLEIDLAQTRLPNDTNQVNTAKVAPGTKGALEIDIDATGTEVSLEYDLDMNLSGIPENLTFYTDSQMTNALFKDNGVIHIEGYFLANDSNKTETKTLYWEWPFESGNSNETIAYNDELDSNWIGQPITLGLQVKGKQIKDDPITKYAVSFDAGAGILQGYGNSDVTTKKLASGDVYGNLPSATRDGYTFLKWSSVLDPDADQQLPDAYQQVEYIQFTGTQYIDTGIDGTSNTRIDTKFDFDEYQTEALFGTSSGANYAHFTGHNSSYFMGIGPNYGERSNGIWTTGIHTLVFNGDNYSISLDGNVLNEDLDITYGPNLRIGFRGDAPEYKLNGKIYYFKITDKSTGNLVRDLVPCYRKSDNVIGFYDKVTNTFYSNNGTGTFGKGDIVIGNITSSTIFNQSSNVTAHAIWAKNVNITFNAAGGTVSPTSKMVVASQQYGELPTPIKEGYTFCGWTTKLGDIPSEYQEVEYVQFNGTQYIDTGVIGENSTVEAKFDFESYQTEVLFGTDAGNSYYHFTAYNDTYFMGKSGFEASNGTWTTGIHTIVYNGDNYSVVLDGQTLSSGEYITSPNNILIGQRTDCPQYRLDGRLYYFKIIDKTTGNVVRDFVPCYKKSNNQIGFYDKVTETFYTSNSNAFAKKGPNVGEIITSSTKVTEENDHTLIAIWVAE